MTWFDEIYVEFKKNKKIISEKEALREALLTVMSDEDKLLL